MILAFHPPIHAKSVFSNSIVVRFLKGVTRLHLLVKEQVPFWDLNVVLKVLMGPPFKPMVASSFALLVRKHLSLWWKHMHGECVSCRASSHTIWPHPMFFFKVVSLFHLNQIIYLTVFFPKMHSTSDEQCLHMLIVRWCLTFYLDSVTGFDSLPSHLLLAIWGIRSQWGRHPSLWYLTFSLISTGPSFSWELSHNPCFSPFLGIL